MKPTRSTLFLLLFLPLATFSLKATQVTESVKCYTPAQQKKVLEAFKGLEGVIDVVNIIVIYAGFEIDEMLGNVDDVSKKGEGMRDRGQDIMDKGREMMMKGEMRKKGKEMRIEGWTIYFKGVEMMDVRKQLLAVIRKMELYNKDKSSEKAWKMIDKGKKTEDKGCEMQGEGGLYMQINGQHIKNEGIGIRNKGQRMLKKKYKTLMVGHGRNTRCHWENLGRIVEWLIISD